MLVACRANDSPEDSNGDSARIPGRYLTLVGACRRDRLERVEGLERLANVLDAELVGYRQQLLSDMSRCTLQVTMIRVVLIWYLKDKLMSNTSCNLIRNPFLLFELSSTFSDMPKRAGVAKYTDTNVAGIVRKLSSILSKLER